MAYNFIDTIEASGTAAPPSEALKLNGEYIEDLIPGYRTLHVTGREALSPEVDSFNTGVRDGATRKYKRYPARYITVTYQLLTKSNEAFRDAFNALGGVLDVEDAELIFADEPDKYFTGTLYEIGEVEPGKNAVIGEFTFFCEDPFKYSVVEYEATADLDERSILIDYNGTYKSFPKLRAEFYEANEMSDDGEKVNNTLDVGECGYVAFFNEYKKIIQLGDPDEVDVEYYAKSQTLLNLLFNKTTSWGTAAKSLLGVNSGRTTSETVVQTGTLAMKVASYAVSSESATTSATLLNVSSTASSPTIKYKVSAKTSGRTANSVKVTVSITGSLGSDSSYFLSGYILNASIYIGGAWRNATLKKATDKWRGKTGHTVNLSFTVTGLSESTNALTGIKFKVTRGDDYGTAGTLGEKTCSNLPISKYSEATPETYYLAPSSFGSGDNWHGPSITRVLPADKAGEVGATNFTLTYSQKMSIGSKSGDTKQLGAFQVLIVSGSGTSRKVLAGANVFKGSTGKKAKLRFYVNGAAVETMDIDLSYNNKYFRSGKSSTISKTGQTITFNICGIKKTFRNSAIKDVAAKEVTFTMTKYGTKPELSYNGLYSVKFVKNNCDTYKDIPNKFSASDIVEADCKDGEIYLNGTSTPDLGALGNDWEGFYLTPGLNQIGYSYSDWLEDTYAPEVKVLYREVFL